MDIDDARAGLADIAARQGQAVAEAARWRWPRWYVVGTAALMLAVSVALDFDHDPALFTWCTAVAWGCCRYRWPPACGCGCTDPGTRRGRPGRWPPC